MTIFSLHSLTIFLPALAILSYQDLRYKQVTGWVFGLFLLTFLVYLWNNTAEVFAISTVNLLIKLSIISAFAAIWIVVLGMRKKILLGVVDGLVLASFVFVLPLTVLPLFFISTGGACFLWHMITKDKTIPFFPPLSLAFMISLFFG